MIKRLFKYCYAGVLGCTIAYSGISVVDKIFSAPNIGVERAVYDDVLKQITGSKQRSVSRDERIVFWSGQLKVAMTANNLRVKISGFGSSFDYYSGKKIEGSPYCETSFAHTELAEGGKMVVRRESVEHRFASFCISLYDFNNDGLVDLISKSYSPEDAWGRTKPKEDLYRAECKDSTLLTKADKNFKYVRAGMHADEFVEAWKEFYNR